MRLGFNPRARYLTGFPMGIFSPSYPSRMHGLGAFNPRKRYLQLAAYHARQRYLTGLGQDEGFDYTSAIQQSEAAAPIIPQQTYTPAQAPAIADVIQAPLALPGSSPIYVPSPSLQAPATAAAAAAPASFFTSSTGGVSNTTLALGLGAIGLLAIALAGGGSRRRENRGRLWP